MPKCAEILAKIDAGLCEPVELDIEFKTPIEAEKVRMLGVIAERDKLGSNGETVLVRLKHRAEGIGGNPEEYFARASALFEILREHRALEFYFGEKRRGASYTETGHGWIHKFPDPSKPGSGFKVVYANQDLSEQSTVSYTATGFKA